MTNLMVCENFPQTRELNSPTSGTNSPAGKVNLPTGNMTALPGEMSFPTSEIVPLPGEFTAPVGEMNSLGVGTSHPTARHQPTVG